MAGDAEEIRPTAAAVAAGTAVSLVMQLLYGNPDDLAKIEASTASFVDILTQQFAAYPDIVNLFTGADNWPMIVAQAHIRNRQDDGSTTGKLAILPRLSWILLRTREMCQQTVILMCKLNIVA